MKKALTVAAVTVLAGTAYAQSTKTDAQTKPAQAAPAQTLNIGDKAPAINVETWVKGEPITGYESGRVYVVEFWATWCGPCIAQMPHLSQIARTYKDKGVAVVGVNIWERKYDDKTLDTVKGFVEGKGDDMGYTVAFDGASKAMDGAFMKAANRRGIPSTFVIDGNANVAWIGHPMWLDAVVEKVVDGTWDYEKGPASIAASEEKLSTAFRMASTEPATALEAFNAVKEMHPSIAHMYEDLYFNLLLTNGQFNKAYGLGEELVQGAMSAKDANKLNAIAWAIVNPEAAIEKRDLNLASKAAENADKISGGESPAIMDTLARVYFLKGEIDRAIEIQTKAVELVPERAKEQYTKALNEYKAAKK